MEGGYQILNLSRWNLTSTSTKIKGAYGFIDNNTEHKTVLLEGLMLEGTRYDAIFTTFAKAADNYVGNFVLNDMIYTIIVRPNDNINIRKLDPVSDTDLNNIVSDEWNASTDYSAGAYVLRSNKLYVSLLPSNGKDPLIEPEYWERKKLVDVASSSDVVEIPISAGSATPQRADIVKCFRTGNVVQMFFWNVSFGVVNSDLHIYTLPIKPKSRVCVTTWNADKTPGGVWINENDGHVNLSKATGVFYATITFICQ